MSLNDPLVTATVGSWTTPNYGVIARDGFGSTRLDASSGLVLKISHTDPLVVNKPARHYMQLQWPANVTDPYSGLVKRQIASASISVSVPSKGWSDANMALLLDELVSILTDSDFTSTKFIAGQS
jgi:hypothetical protein